MFQYPWSSPSWVFRTNAHRAPHPVILLSPSASSSPASALAVSSGRSYFFYFIFACYVFLLVPFLYMKELMNELMHIGFFYVSSLEFPGSWWIKTVPTFFQGCVLAREGQFLTKKSVIRVPLQKCLWYTDLYWGVDQWTIPKSVITASSPGRSKLSGSQWSLPSSSANPRHHLARWVSEMKSLGSPPVKECAVALVLQMLCQQDMYFQLLPGMLLVFLLIWFHLWSMIREC